MLKIFTALLISVALVVIGCGAFNEGDRFVVGYDEFAPMGFHDESGELVGFDIDLARETAKRMGVTFEFKPIDWNHKREAITGGEVDIIWNGLDFTDERNEYMTFSKPYMDDRQILLVRKGNPQDIHSVSDLTGKIIGTQAGSSSETQINSNEKLLSTFASINTYHDINGAFAALNSGEIDVLIIDEIAARYEMVTHPNTVEIVETKIGSASKIVIGFRKEDVELRDRVQKTFDEMVKDGTAHKISEKWFQADLIKHKR